MTDARDKLLDILEANPNDYHAADAILTALPEIVRAMVKPLDMPERRNGYWGHKGGYQIAHTMDDKFRVRLNGRVIFRNIKGFAAAIAKANDHHAAHIIAALGLEVSGD